VAEIGSPVRQGDLIGRLHDFGDHSSTPLEIKSPRDGWMLMMHLSARPRKGVTLFVVGREV
jgi:predicted deacylase